MSWPTVRLDECTRVVGGATPSTSVTENWDGEINWATPKDLSDLDSIYISQTPRKITEVGLKSCAAEVLPTGSVLFSSRAPIGHVAITTAPMATNQGFKSFIPNTTLVTAGYLYWWLKANRRFLEGLGNGATFKEVSKAVVSRVQIPLPPLDEQRRIAAILDQADALRRKRRDHASRIAALVSAKFQAMFGDPIGTKLLHPAVELASLIDPSRPITYGILKPGPDLPNGVPYVRVVDIKDGRVLTDQLRCTSPEIAHQYRRSTLRTGDVLMSIRGHVGRMALVPPEAAGANITQDTARLAIVGANPIFVRALMEHPLSKRWMAERTRGIAVQGINLGDLKKFPVLVPPKREQDNFAEFYKEVQLNRSAGDIQLAHLDALFASLQHRAFRGEL
ncbi:restriction endonuclease subunit S [Caulobacter segnis]|uniref:Type I restriction modification DNA specificity domain-containing protein n=1 Tax=Caulobacter segnis TaxID=88688 RepID=A0A2W5V3N4_9CAUL|nr:restriction endonuclease subunit S [Caulobacter segnis]PZR34420.1 MAG: hypothetical protein DI526_10465 [Caulobacter segnis]